MVGLEHMSEEDLNQAETEFASLRARQAHRTEAKKTKVTMSTHIDGAKCRSRVASSIIARQLQIFSATIPPLSIEA